MASSDITAKADLLEALTAIGIAAADAILQYRQGGAFRIKADGSPVTPADEAAEAVIRHGLERAAPAWPIVSEEQAERVRPSVGSDYFLVDPLDGTREFIGGRDEYTVNIGLVCGSAPALGIVIASTRLDLAGQRRPGRRAAALFVGQSRTAAGDSYAQAAGRRTDRHGQPLPSRSPDASLCRRAAARPPRELRLVGEILPPGRRHGGSLSTPRADARLGCGGRPRRPRGGGWQHNGPRWRRLEVRHARSAHPRLRCLGRSAAEAALKPLRVSLKS